MEFAASNIAWETADMDEHLEILAKECSHLELSPSMVWAEPALASEDNIMKLKQQLKYYGVNVISAHSLTYTRPDLVFFDTVQKRNELVEYVSKLGEIAQKFNCPHLVFGSSRARSIANRCRSECMEILIETFRQMATETAKYGVAVLIEPLSPQETDCINTVKEGADLVTEVNHPAFGLHVDLKSTFSQMEDQEQLWGEYGGLIQHCHVADPGLLPPSTNCPYHRLAAKAMRKAGYDRYISIEMGRKFGNTKENLQNALRFVKETYSN